MGLPLAYQRSEPQFGVGERIRVRRELGQQPLCVLCAIDLQVVVRELQARGWRLGDFRHHLERLLGLIGSLRGDVENTEHAVGEQVLGIDRERVFDGLLGFVRALGRPQKIGERQLRVHRIRIEGDGLAECGLCLRRVSAVHAYCAKADERAAVPGAHLHRLFDLGNGARRIFQCGERVGAKEQRVNVLRVLGEKRCHPRLRVFEAARQEKHLRGFDLRVAIVGHRVGGANELGERRAIVHALERLRQFEAGFAELRVDLDGVGVLNDRKLVFLFGSVLVAALQMLLFLHLRVAARGRHESEGKKQHRARS